MNYGIQNMFLYTIYNYIKTIYLLYFFAKKQFIQLFKKILIIFITHDIQIGALHKCNIRNN